MVACALLLTFPVFAVDDPFPVDGVVRHTLGAQVMRFPSGTMFVERPATFRNVRVSGIVEGPSVEELSACLGLLFIVVPFFAGFFPAFFL